MKKCFNDFCHERHFFILRKKKYIFIFKSAKKHLAHKFAFKVDSVHLNVSYLSTHGQSDDLESEKKK